MWTFYSVWPRGQAYLVQALEIFLVGSFGFMGKNLRFEALIFWRDSYVGFVRFGS